VLCIISVSLVCLDNFASNWLARPYPVMHFVEEYISTKTRLHEGLLTFKQKTVYMSCFGVFIIVLVNVIF